VALLLVALAARWLFLILSGSHGQVINHDASDYVRIARSLLAGEGFAFGPGQPTAFRPVGYPFFVAAVYGLVGAQVAALQGLQALLGALLVLPTYALARRLAGPRVALLAGLGVAVHPVLLYLPAVIAPETLAMLLQMWALWFALLVLERTQWRWIDLSGYVLASTAAALLRPELLVVSGLVAVGLLVWVGAGSRPVRALVLASGAILVLTLGPPLVRNWLTFGTFLPFPTIGGVTFWGGNNAAVRGGWIMPTADTWPGEDTPRGMRGWPGLSEGESQARFYRAAFDWMRSEPGAWLALGPRKLARAWTLSWADESRERSVPWAAAVAQAAFGVLVLVGMVLPRHRYRPAWWLLFAPLLGWFVKTVLFYGSARQTAPVLPILCIFAAVAVERAAVALIRLLGPLWAALPRDGQR
jgi:hypothetical protein